MLSRSPSALDQPCSARQLHLWEERKGEGEKERGRERERERKREEERGKKGKERERGKKGRRLTKIAREEVGKGKK